MVKGAPFPMIALLSISVLSTSVTARERFKLISPNIKDGGSMPTTLNRVDCGGKNISPALSWSGAPRGTKSFVITIDHYRDLAQPFGETQWVVFNIPAGITNLSEGAGSGIGALPIGAVQSRTAFGRPGYAGSCAPPGLPRRYVYTVLALVVEKLPLDAQATPIQVGVAAGVYEIAAAKLTTYATPVKSSDVKKLPR